MRAIGVLLMLVGVAGASLAFGIDGAAPGERVLNIGLLNQKVMLATVGGALFVGGAALIGAAGIVTAIEAHQSVVFAEIRGEREDLRIGFKSLWDELDRVRANTEPSKPVPVYGTTPIATSDGRLQGRS